MTKLPAFLREAKATIDSHQTVIELSATILLAVIAYQANRIADYSNTVLERQLLVQEAELAPVFRLREPYIYDKKSKKAAERWLIVENTGAPITEVNTEKYGFLQIDSYKNGPAELILVPFLFYTASSPTRATTGELVTYFGHLNLQKLADVDRQSIEFSRGGGYFIELSVTHYISVSYKNALGKQDRRFYVINNSNAVEIGEAEYSSKKKFWDQLGRKYTEISLDIDELTLDHVVRVIEGKLQALQ